MKFNNIALLFLILLMSGCVKGTTEVQSKQDILDVIDKLDCTRIASYYDQGAKTTDDVAKQCNLKNNYTVVDEKLYKSGEYDVRELTLKLNGYNFEFTALSSLGCTNFVSATCSVQSYMVTTDYFEKANEYFEKEFKKENQNTICDEIDGKFGYCYVKSLSDVEVVTNYINAIIDYLNNINIKFYSPNESFNYLGAYLGEKANNRGWYSILFKPRLVDGKYYLFNNGKKVDNLKNEILNYIDEENLSLK